MSKLRKTTRTVDAGASVVSSAIKQKTTTEPEKIPASVVSSAIKQSISSVSGSGYASVKENSRTASKFFNPYIKKWEPADSEDGKLLKIIIKNCYRCKDGYIYDIKKKKCVKITQKNRLEYEKIINFCSIYKKEIAYRNKVDLEIIHKILNTQIDFENRKILIKDIARLPDKFVDDMANKQGVDAVIANISIFMAKLVEENPAIGEEVKRKMIDVVNKSDEVFSSLFLTLFSKKEETGLFKSLLLTLNPTNVLSIIAGAVTSFAAIMSPIFNVIGRLKPVEYATTVYDKIKTQKIIRVKIPDKNTTVALNNDVLYSKNKSYITKDFNIEVFNTTLENLGIDTKSKNPQLKDLTDALINGDAVIRFNNVVDIEGKKFNEYTLYNPKSKTGIVTFVNQRAKETYAKTLNNIPFQIEKYIKNISKYFGFQEQISIYENNRETASSVLTRQKLDKKRTQVINKHFTQDTWRLINDERVSQFIQEISRETRFISKTASNNRITDKNVNSSGFMINDVYKGMKIYPILRDISNSLSGDNIPPDFVISNIDNYFKEKEKDYKVIRY